jgi:hypothetical protein
MPTIHLELEVSRESLAAVLVSHSCWGHLLSNPPPGVSNYQLIIAALQQISLQGIPAGGPVKHFILEALGAVLGAVYTKDICLWTLFRASGNAELLRVFLEAGANPNVNDEGHTLLHFLTAFPDTKPSIEVLLQFKANIHARDSFFGFTPLTWAVVQRRLDLVQFLRAHGAAPARRIHGEFFSVRRRSPKNGKKSMKLPRAGSNR